MNKLNLYLNLILTGWFVIPQLAYSQIKSDTLKLKEVEIISSFTLRSEGFKKVMIDSSLLIPQINTDLSTVLSQHSTIFMKTYGNGSLATPSMRGTTASHTQVEWNGININSPMLGMTDFSQIPVFEINDVEVLYGAAGITRAGGAFGGVINLLTNPDWSSRYRITGSITGASFDTYNDNIAVTAGNDKIQTISKIYYTYSKNNFSYDDDFTNTTKTQKNGEYQYAGGSEEMFFKLGSKDFLTTRLWYNSSMINLPPPLSSYVVESQEAQENKDLYSKLEWKHLGKNNLLTVWTGMIDHYMKYTNIEGTVDNHHAYSWVNKLRWNYSGWKIFVIKPGIDFNWDWVRSDKYEDLKKRISESLFSEFILKYPKKFSFNLTLREDYMDNKFLPLIAAIGGEFDPLKSHNLSFTINFSKNYKYPSLNDLYYEVLGNPELKPETDYSAESGIVFNFMTRNRLFFAESEVTGYMSRMYDLIIWTPGAGGLFRPSNVAQVFARGLECGLNFRLQPGNWKISLSNNYHFCRSTNEKTTSPNDASLGKQLIYIPVHTFNSTLTLDHSGYNFTFNCSYFSERFTSTSNLTSMDPYFISNIIFGKSFHLPEILLSLQLQINNLFDLNYQSIVNRPMPGRNMAVTLKVDFGK